MAKCPKCNATIEEGVTLCGNCKASIVWKNKQPRLSGAYITKEIGKNLTIIGCLIPLIITIIFFLYTTTKIF